MERASNARSEVATSAIARLREQPARPFCLHHALHPDRHGRHAMRNFVRLSAPDYLSKGMFHDTEKFISHFRLAPRERLETLHPFEIGNDYASRVAQDIGNDKNFRPTLIKNLIRFRCGRSVGAFGQDAAL